MNRDAQRPTDPPEKCPKCGEPTYDGDKDTSSGRDLRTYFCSKSCGWLETYDVGVALWAAMSQANKR